MLSPSRVVLLSSILLSSHFASVRGADNDTPPIPVEKRKAIIEGVVAKKPKGEDIILLKIKAAEMGKIDSKLKTNKYPEDPAESPIFTSKLGKSIHITELKTQLEKAREESKKYAADPMSFAPSLKGFDKGEIGYFNHDFVRVANVVDSKQVLLTISPLGGGNKTTVLLSGIDAGNLADGKKYPLVGVFYVAGNQKVGGQTVMQLVPFIPTADERKQFGLAELIAEKK